MAGSNLLWRSVARGGRRRCPHCGEGALFRRWVEVEQPCRACDTRVLADQGDAWAFLVILDRVFILLLIGIIFFRLGPPNTPGLIALFAGITALFVYTTPHRFGVCIGLAYGVGQRRAAPGTDGDAG